MILIQKNKLMRKIRYINVHGYMLLGYTNNFFDTYQKALRQQFPNLDVSDNNLSHYKSPLYLNN